MQVGYSGKEDREYGKNWDLIFKKETLWQKLSRCIGRFLVKVFLGV